MTPATQQVQSGQIATLTVGLLSGYNTLVVTGGGGTLNGSTYTTGPITANTTITTSATANPVYYTVTASVGTGTTATPATQQVLSGQTATLTVGLLSGYNTLVVNGGGGTLNGTIYTTGPITANTTITTSATAPVVTYTVTAPVAPNGTVTPASITVNSGSPASFTVTPNTGYSIGSVTSTLGGSISGNTYTIPTVTGNGSVSAVFVPTMFTVSANIGTGTTATPQTQQIPYGGTASINVGLLPGYMDLVVQSIGDGSFHPNTNTYIVTNATRNSTITTSATLAPLGPFTVSLTAGLHGSVTPTSQVVARGVSAIFTATPDPGYEIDWLNSTSNRDMNHMWASGNKFQTGPITSDTSVFVPFTQIVDTGSAYILKYMRASHGALFDDEFETTPITLEVKAKGSGFTLFAEYSKAAFSGYDFTTVKIQLKDDGNGVDRIASDGIYSATFMTGLVPILWSYDKTIHSLQLRIVAYDGAGNVVEPLQTTTNILNIGVVGRSLTTTTTVVAPGVISTPHALHFEMPEVASDGFTEWEVAWKLYAYYPDVFDVINGGYMGYAESNFTPNDNPMRNEALGIGEARKDFSWTYGSNGVLRNYVMAGFDSKGFAFLHEFGHQWGFSLDDPRLTLADRFSHPKGPRSYVGIMSLSGALLVEQPSGDFLVTYRPNGSGNTFAPLELYLMGLNTPLEVPPMWFALDPSLNTSIGQILPRAKLSQVTINDIIAVYGTRTPVAGESQKLFRGAFIYVYDHPPTAAELAYGNRVGEFYGSKVEGMSPLDPVIHPGQLDYPTWWSATEHKSELNTLIPPPK